MFRMPEIITIKQGHPKKITDKCPIRVNPLCSPNCINVVRARVEFNEPFLFQKERKQEAHFDYYCQRPLHTDSTAHCKMVEWNTHPYSFDMPKTSNFMAKTNTELYKSTTAEACAFQSPTTRFFFTNFYQHSTIMQNCRNVKDSKQPP